MTDSSNISVIAMAEGRVKQKATKDTEENQYESKCGKCNKPVIEQDNEVNCEICEIWFHSKCQGMPEAMYKVLNQYNWDLHWFCKSCNTGPGKLLTTLSKLHTKIETLEDEMEKMKTEQNTELARVVKEFRVDGCRIEQCEKKIDEHKHEVDSNLTTKLTDLENKLDDCSNKDPPPQWSDIVAKHIIISSFGIYGAAVVPDSG